MKLGRLHVILLCSMGGKVLNSHALGWQREPIH